VIGHFFVPIAQFGWAAVVLAAIGLALITLLVASASLVAWRVFSPLPSTPTDLQEAPQNIIVGLSPPIGTPELAAELRGEVRRLTGEIADIRKQIKIDLPNASTVVEAFTNLDMAVHMKVDRIDDFSARMANSEQDMQFLLDWAISRASVQLIDALLKTKPSINKLEAPVDDVARKNSMDEVRTWLAKIGSETYHLAYGAEISRALANSEYEGQGEVRRLPPESFPQGIDAIKFHDFYVMAVRCEMMERCLRATISEIERHESSRLSRLRDLMERHKQR